MKRLLFVCSQNRLRSPTAQAIFSGIEGIEVASAGLDTDAAVPISAILIEWAQIVFVMERSHRNRLMKKFYHLVKGKRVVVLDIPDQYDYMEADLVALLRERVSPFLPGDR